MFVHFDCSEVGLSMYQKCTTTNHLKKKFLGVEPLRVPYQDARLWLCHSQFWLCHWHIGRFFSSSSGVANVHPTRSKSGSGGCILYVHCPLGLPELGQVGRPRQAAQPAMLATGPQRPRLFEVGHVRRRGKSRVLTCIYIYMWLLTICLKV